MNIAIDIDDTTFLTVKSMLKYADKYEEEISGVPTNRDSFGSINGSTAVSSVILSLLPLLLILIARLTAFSILLSKYWLSSNPHHRPYCNYIFLPAF